MAYRGGFGGFGGGGNQMQNLMRQAQKMQEEMQKAQAELEETEVEGSAGGGLVKVTMTAKKVVTGVSISPDAVDMDDLTSAIPAFVTLVMMPLTYSISNGIGLGAIAYTLMKIFTGKFKAKDIMVAIIAILFALRFIFVTM